MASTAQVAVSDYLRTAYEPDAEYVDGEIEERPVGELDHASWQSAIQQWFLSHAHQWNIRVLAELRVQVDPTRFRVPDVALIDRALPKEQIITKPPIAVFEILSPEDRLPRILVKLQDYERMGIRNIFMVDPKDASIWRFRRGELVPGESGLFEDSPCVVDWEQIGRYAS